MTIGQIATEISAKVVWLEENNGATIYKAWLINAVMSDHSQIDGADLEFAICCARFTVADQVDRYFRSVKQQEETNDPQQKLPGFECLQKRYLLMRDNEQVIVKIEHMTDDEMDAKANQLDRMSDGLRLHAEELRQYKTQRQLPLLANG